MNRKMSFTKEMSQRLGAGRIPDRRAGVRLTRGAAGTELPTSSNRSCLHTSTPSLLGLAVKPSQAKNQSKPPAHTCATFVCTEASAKALEVLEGVAARSIFVDAQKGRAATERLSESQRYDFLAGPGCAAAAF